MRCKVCNCVNNDNGYCCIDDYVTIEEDGTCSELIISPLQVGNRVMFTRYKFDHEYGKIGTIEIVRNSGIFVRFDDGCAIDCEECDVTPIESVEEQ